VEQNLRRFIDEHVIITGAGSGIGCGIAKRFASEGAKVVVADVDQAGGTRVVQEITSMGGTALFLPVVVAK
jgi:3-oxoacyl-[acyl-carrier protein] reductase